MIGPTTAVLDRILLEQRAQGDPVAVPVSHRVMHLGLGLPARMLARPAQWRAWRRLLGSEPDVS